MERLNKNKQDFISDLDEWKSNEKGQLEKIQDDTKALEKMTNKQSLLLKKVSLKI